MSESVAQAALRKAHYFLAQARLAESDSSILTERLPYMANLEAAIIYARSSLDHLHNEFAPKYNEKGYRNWHDKKWQTLQATNSVFKYFVERRNFIIHKEPEKTNANVSIETEMSISMSMSVQLTVTRANGTVETNEPMESEKAAGVKESAPSKTSQTFFFAEPDWRASSAIVYVGDFIGICDSFVSDAGRKFSGGNL